MTNEEKAIEIANNDGLYNIENGCIEDCRIAALEMAKWKDEQYMQDRSGFCNFLKEWAQGWLIERLTAFAVHLQKRGAFRDDLCMDFEHEAQSFIEFQKFNATQKGK